MGGCTSKFNQVKIMLMYWRIQSGSWESLKHYVASMKRRANLSKRRGCVGRVCAAVATEPIVCTQLVPTTWACTWPQFWPHFAIRLLVPGRCRYRIRLRSTEESRNFKEECKDNYKFTHVSMDDMQTLRVAVGRRGESRHVKGFAGHPDEEIRIFSRKYHWKCKCFH